MGDQIRNFLLILTAFGTILGFYIKAFTNLPIEVIKMKYKHISGKENLFQTVISLIAVVSAIVDILYIGIVIFIIGKPIINGDSINTLMVSEYDYSSIYIIIAIILIGCVVILPLAVFTRYKKLFIDKLENDNIGSSKKVVYLCMEFITVIVSGIFFVGCLGSIIYEIYNGISIKRAAETGIVVFENNIKDFNSLVLMVSFCILFLTSLLIILALIRQRKEIYDERVYYIYLKYDIFICGLYLDIGEYYLIFDNGIEKYIKKSEVVRIVRNKRIDTNEIPFM